MKSNERIGELNKRIRNDEVLSFASSVPEKSAKNTVPNMAMPGAIRFVSNIVLFASGGIAELIMENKNINMSGKPNPKNRLIGSRRISFPFRFEKI